jgi:hypothetical protein
MGYTHWYEPNLLLSFYILKSVAAWAISVITESNPIHTSLYQSQTIKVIHLVQTINLVHSVSTKLHTTQIHISFSWNWNFSSFSYYKATHYKKWHLLQFKLTFHSVSPKMTFTSVQSNTNCHFIPLHKLTFTSVQSDNIQETCWSMTIFSWCFRKTS